MRSSGACVAIVLSSLVVPCAVAQDAADAERDARARALFDLGTRRYQEERYGEAARAYEGAYALSPRALILLNAATAYERALELDRAADALERYLVLAGEIEDAERLRERVRRLRELGSEPQLPEAPTPPALAPLVLWPVPEPPPVRPPPSSPPPDPGPSGWLVAGGALGALAAVLAGFAIGAGAVALDASRDLAPLCPNGLCSDSISDRLAGARATADASTGLGFASSISGAASIVFLVIGALAPGVAPRVELTRAANGAGAMVRY